MMLKPMSVLLMLVVIYSGQLFANEINYLNVEGSIVYFSTSASKASTAPTCAAPSTNEQYAVSLNNESGKALYSLLITAMASKQGVNVASARDCADVAGFERALGVSISPVSASSGSSSDLYLYLADGTELGLIAGNEINNKVSYLSSDNTHHFLYTSLPLVSPEVFFEGADCTGRAGVVSRGVSGHHSFNGGNLFYANSRISLNINSKLNESGTCDTHVESVYLYYASTLDYNHHVCGTKLCVIKRK